MPDCSHRILSSLRCQRPSLSLEDQQPKAVMKALSTNDELRRQCAIQQAFDAEIAARVSRVEIGEREDLLAPVPHSSGMRSQLAQPVVIAVAAALLFLAAYFGYRLYDRLTLFQGHEVVDALLEHAESGAGEEFEPFEGKAGLLGDWFLLNNALDNYGVATDMSDLDAAGWRVIQLNGHPVAQHLVEKPPTIISVLHADKHRIHASDHWQYVRHHDWTAAVRQQGNRVTVVAMLDEEEAVRKFIHALDGG